jgi:hypothetical protein
VESGKISGSCNRSCDVDCLGNWVRGRARTNARLRILQDPRATGVSRKATNPHPFVVCHADSNNGFRLEPLSPGAASWNDEQSRKNFEMAAKLVNPGDPGTSRLLMQPLAPEGGGNIFHSGGRQFGSKDDPGWKTLAAWVNGQR